MSNSSPPVPFSFELPDPRIGEEKQIQLVYTAFKIFLKGLENATAREMDICAKENGFWEYLDGVFRHVRRFYVVLRGSFVGVYVHQYVLLNLKLVRISHLANTINREHARYSLADDLNGFRDYIVVGNMCDALMTLWTKGRDRANTVTFPCRMYLDMEKKRYHPKELRDIDGAKQETPPGYLFPQGDFTPVSNSPVPATSCSTAPTALEQSDEIETIAK